MNKATGSILNFTRDMRTSPKTGKNFTIHGFVLSDGQQYEVGFNPLKGYSPGDNISFHWELKYGKRSVVVATITGAAASPSTGSYGYDDETPATPVAPLPPATPKGQFKPWNEKAPKPFPIPKDHGDRSITRQNALTNARELVCSMTGVGAWDNNLDAAAEKIIQIAYKFEEYTTGDREVNAVKAEKSKKVSPIKKDEPSVLEGLTGTDDEPF